MHKPDPVLFGKVGGTVGIPVIGGLVGFGGLGGLVGFGSIEKKRKKKKEIERKEKKRKKNRMALGITRKLILSKHHTSIKVF